MSLETQDWPISSFREYPNNPRINDHAVSQMAATIKEFGFRVPMIVRSDGELIDGHLRLKAARVLGLQTLPVVVADDLTEVQIRALRIAVNQAATWAEWDMPMLKQEMAALDQTGFNIPLLGFSADRVREILANPSAHDPDDAPELPLNPVSRLGDLWIMGDHRLLCGDSTKPEDVARLLGKAKPHLMVTDPPYGVNYDPDWRNRALRTDSTPSGARAIGTVKNDDQSNWIEAWRLFPGDVVYCWHAGLHASNTQLAFEACGFDLRAQIIWAKSNLVIGRGHYHVQHEPCYYMVRKGATGQWNGGRTQTTLWQIDKPHKSETGHSTQKPIECMRRPIENNSVPGDGVYDPFMGSGTSLIAAELTARKAYGIEIDPGYIDVSVRRWQKISGREAVLETIGATFDEIALERGVEIEFDPVPEPKPPDTGALIISNGQLVTE